MAFTVALGSPSTIQSVSNDTMLSPTTVAADPVLSATLGPKNMLSASENRKELSSI
jgi:hypothetical protein